MKVKCNFSDLPDDQEITLTKQELIEYASEQTVNGVGEFINQCGEMAEANWCPAMVEDLVKLFNCVLKGEPYAPEPEEE